MTLEELQLDLAHHTAASQKLISAAQVRAAQNYEAQMEAEKQKAIHEMETTKKAVERAAQHSQNFMRPCLIFRPCLSHADNQWVATYGGLAASGPTPETAHQEFDRMWVGKDEL
jgi:hypothetical protein